MGNFYMEATQINYRRDDKLKTVDQKLQELSETSAIDTDIAPVFKSTNTYQPGDMVYYRNKLYVFNVEHTGAWAAADVTATDVTTELSSLKSGLTNYENQNDFNLEVPDRKNLLNYNAWSSGVYGVKCTVVTENNGATLTATDGDAYTVYKPNEFPLDARVPVKVGNNITLSWVEESNKSGNVYIFGDGNTVLASVNNANDKKVSCTIPNGVTFVTFRLGVEDAGETISYKNIQIEYGSTATAYSPYIPSVESRIEAVENKQMVKTSESVTLNANGQSRLSVTLANVRLVYCTAIESNETLLALPYITSDGYWAVKVVNPTDMSAYASATVDIVYGYIPN